MIPVDIPRTPAALALAEHVQQWKFRNHLQPTWVAAAIAAWDRGTVQAIPSRDGRGLYLARFWVTPPRLLPVAERTDRSPWDSSDSTLLHFFAHGDEDPCLHDHPWDFTTRILTGSYDEHLPPALWRGTAHDQPGPAWRDVIRRRTPADGVRRVLAQDLHLVSNVAEGTWTLVTTGPKLRTWGFWPEGQPWIDWRSYIAQRRAPASADGAARDALAATPATPIGAQPWMQYRP